MQSPVEQFLVGRHIAVVGVSRSAEKYGAKVYRLLAAHGYVVYGVNPNMTELDGQPVYPSLSAIKDRLDGVVVIVPPAAAVDVIRETARLEIPLVWLQPGSESEEASTVASQLGINLIRDTCIMLRSAAEREAK